MAEVSNDKIFELINSTRLELKGDISRVDGKVDALGGVELAKVREDLNKLMVKNATLNVKVYTLVFIISTVCSALVTALAAKLVGV